MNWDAAAPSGLAEGEHPLHVPGQGHQVPLAFHLFEAAQVELSETHDRLDDAEHRFRGLLAQGIGLPTLGRGQSVHHRLRRSRILRRRRRRGETLFPGAMMVLAQASTLASL